MNPYLNQYRDNQILTASPEQILIMLYDGAIRFASLAQNCLNEGDMAGKGKYVGKVIAILAEFSSSLNYDIGPELAENLDALYSYMIGRLGHANINNDPGPIEEVKEMLIDLRQTWKQAVEINNGNSTLQEHVGQKAAALSATAAA